PVRPSLCCLSRHHERPGTLGPFAPRCTRRSDLWWLPRGDDSNIPTVALTAKSVLALPAREGGARSDYWDEKVAGLVLRVTAKARTYSVWYRINGAARRFTLGPADEITLADARARALEIRAQTRVGVDAVVVKRAAAAEAEKARLVGETFADLTVRYLESAATGDAMKRGEALAPRTLDEYRRMLKADVIPSLGGIAPGEIAKAHVRA